MLNYQRVSQMQVIRMHQAFALWIYGHDVNQVDVGRSDSVLDAPVRCHFQIPSRFHCPEAMPTRLCENSSKTHRHLYVYHQKESSSSFSIMIYHWSYPIKSYIKITSKITSTITFYINSEYIMIFSIHLSRPARLQSNPKLLSPSHASKEMRCTCQESNDVQRGLLCTMEAPMDIAKVDEF